MIDVQQRLRPVLDADAVLGLVVLGERAEVVVGKLGAGVQLVTDLGHVEKLTTESKCHQRKWYEHKATLNK